MATGGAPLARVDPVSRQRRAALGDAKQEVRANPLQKERSGLPHATTGISKTLPRKHGCPSHCDTKILPQRLRAAPGCAAAARAARRASRHWRRRRTPTRDAPRRRRRARARRDDRREPARAGNHGQRRRRPAEQGRGHLGRRRHEVPHRRVRLGVVGAATTSTIWT